MVTLPNKKNNIVGEIRLNYCVNFTIIYKRRHRLQKLHGFSKLRTTSNVSEFFEIF